MGLGWGAHVDGQTLAAGGMSGTGEPSTKGPRVQGLGWWVGTAVPWVLLETSWSQNRLSWGMAGCTQSSAGPALAEQPTAHGWCALALRHLATSAAVAATPLPAQKGAGMAGDAGRPSLALGPYKGRVCNIQLLPS